jgi:hydrogenase maturation protease
MSGAKVLVAGIGNIFFGDDGFGVEVARRLSTMELSDQLRVADYGIRGMHLAYDLLAGYDVTILVDAVSRGGPPGTIYVLDVAGLRPAGRQLDPHGMTPDAVLELAVSLGAELGRVFVVGCEPACVDERIGLSPVIAASVQAGAGAVLDLAREQLADLASAGPDEARQATRMEV